MNYKIKKYLSEVFEAPEPIHKNEFLKKLPPRQISTGSFLLSQIGYIRKWVWAIDFLVLLLTILCPFYTEENVLWIVSSMTPLLALVFITETGRSELYGMTEFELATRFSLKSVILARLGILGIANLAVFLLLIPICDSVSGYSLLRTGIYLFCPYLTTVFLGFWTSRKIQGRECVYACAGITALVSCSCFLLPATAVFIYDDSCFIWWLLFFFLLFLGVIKEIRRIIQSSGELLWN